MIVIPQSALHKIDGQISDVDSNPAALEAFGHGNGRATAAEGIENDIPLVAAGLDDPLEESFWLLRGVAQAFLGARVNRVDICPDISREYARHFVKVALQPGSLGFGVRVPDSTLPV